jgi:UDP-2,4-diacetamido-2,4,6-trideoxy-beta-L-altropyranose hydrolase
MRQIAFRTDASSQIGSGHFMRCLTLAAALQQRGASIRFLCRALPAHLAEMLAARSIALAALPAVPASGQAGALAHAHWLPVSQAQDAQACIAALAGQPCDWLVVDHYALAAPWETALRGAVARIMAIDDIADRVHDCDVLLDQNNYPDMQTRYLDKVAPACELLLGPSFALLRDEFRSLRAAAGARKAPFTRLLVFFGGVDADNYTGRTIDALRQLAIPGLAVDIVIGAQHPARAAIVASCAALAYTCHVQTPRMAELMARADWSIGAGGSASWERCCLGLPAILAATADNQIDIARALDALGACIYLAPEDSATAAGIGRKIAALAADPGQLEAISRAASTLVDGLGVDRVCSKLGF